jgi:hypothetical protein
LGNPFLLGRLRAFSLGSNEPGAPPSASEADRAAARRSVEARPRGVKVAYIFSTSGHTANYKLGKMILAQLEQGNHGVAMSPTSDSRTRK